MANMLWVPLLLTLCHVLGFLLLPTEAQRLPPILNKCCEDGNVYEPDSDGCVPLKADSATLQSDNNETTESNTDILTPTDNNEFGSNNNLVIPRRLILDLTDGAGNDNSTEFLFDLSVNLPKSTCSKGHFIHRMNLTDFLKRSQENGSGDPSKNKASATPQIVFTTGAQLLVGTEYYSAPEFCVIGLKGEILSLRVCNATCGGVTPCITRCCHLDRVWNKNKLIPKAPKSCVPAGPVKWAPALYNKIPKKKASPKDREGIHPHYKILGNPTQVKCPNGSRLLGKEHRDDAGQYVSMFRFTVNGELHFRKGRYSWVPAEDSFNYCWDGLLNSPYLEGNGTETEYSGKGEVLFQCSSPPTSAQKLAESQSILYGSVMIIACIFLLLTILVHIAIWDKQPNHVWHLTLISYCATLLCFYVVLATMHFVQSSLRRGQDTSMYSFCYFIGVGVNFFTISTFCWLSMINYDIFRTFKCIRPPSNKGLKRYFVYSAFAWSLPITVVTVALILDKVYRADVESSVIVPEYGVKRCNLDADYAQFVYNYGFVGVLLLFNFACFFVTVYSMYKIRKSTKFATTSSTKNTKQIQSLKLFAKLLFIMGLPYLFEFISWYTEKDKVDGNAWYWTITDVFNILQAIAIFYIFVCKPDVLHHLEQKYPSLRTVTKILSGISKKGPTSEPPSTQRTDPSCSALNHQETAH